MCCVRRNTASYVELLNMSEFTVKFPARKKRGAKSAHGERKVYVFIIQFLVPITLILINLVFSMNLIRFVHLVRQGCVRLWRKTYQCCIPIYRESIR
jgi:hypothetical protein